MTAPGLPPGLPEVLAALCSAGTLPPPPCLTFEAH